MMKFLLFFVLTPFASIALSAQGVVDLNDLRRFDESQDDVVFDKATQLTWETCSQGQNVDKKIGCSGVVSVIGWSDAKKFERKGWRLPTRDELVTLISKLRDENKTIPRIDQSIFYRVDKTKLNYWTSDSAGASEAWYVNFGLGPITGKADKNSQFAVRLVKGTFVPPAPEVKPPQDIYDFLRRRDDCNHFAGEIAGEPNSSARDRQIDKTMTEMRCSRIETDEKKLRRKYQAKPDMLKWLDARPE